MAWFSCSLSACEKRILGIENATCEAQQVVESLAVLVALRGWKARWHHERVQLRVKSDSVSALVLAMNLKTAGRGTSIVAREMALDIASSEYRPHIAEHIPGVDNVIADALSRRFAPDYAFVMPACLAHVPELKLADRDEAYFRTLRPQTSPAN